MLVKVVGAGFLSQMRVISALIVREFRLKNSKRAFSLLADLLESIALIGGMAAYMIFMRHQVPIGDSLILFMATGTKLIMYFKTLSMRTAIALQTARSITLLPPVHALDYAIALSFVCFVHYTLLFAVVFSALHVFQVSQYAIPYDFKPVVLAYMLVTVLALGVGLCNSFMLLAIPGWRMVYQGISRALMIFSGTFFIPEYNRIPMVKELMTWNPMMHMISLFRSGFYPSYPTHLISVPYVLKWIVITMLIGLTLERVTRNYREALRA